jgi:hypothetical protein
MHDQQNIKYCYEFIISEKKTGPIIPVAAAAHHTPAITSCNSTSSINKGYSTYLLLSSFRYPLRLNPTSSVSRTELGVYFFIMHPKKVQFCLWICVTDFLNHSCLEGIKTQWFCCNSCWWRQQVASSPALVDPTCILQVSPISHQFPLLSPQLARLFCVFLSCL